MKELFRPKNKKGFTMAELLIVVAIIAVLVAIAVPVFNAKIEKTREAVDVHTMRSAAALASEVYLAGIDDDDALSAMGLTWYHKGQSDADLFGVYDPGAGQFFLGGYDSFYDASNKPILDKAYGKGTSVNGGMEWKGSDNKKIYDPALDYSTAVCQVRILPNQKKIEVAWKNLKGSSKTSGRKWVGENNAPKLVIPIN